MGLQVASSKATSAAGKSLVFAVSGAGTGEGAGRQVKDALLGYGMLNQLRDFAARHLADFKVPRKVVFLAEIPKGATGKLMRIGLAEKLGITV